MILLLQRRRVVTTSIALCAKSDVRIVHIFVCTSLRRMTIYSYVLRCAAASSKSFIVTSSDEPTDHCTATSCRPDLVALDISKFTSQLPSTQTPQPPNANEGCEQAGGREQAEPSPTDLCTAANPRLTDTLAPANAPSVPWVNLEAVIAVHSKHKSVLDNIRQAVAYTGYLLAARPDRVAVLGLYISLQGFALILVDPTGVYHTDQISWGEPLEKNPLPRVLT